MDPYRPIISVIIPVYNTGIRLRYCMESILHQTLKDLEIIIVDDGSDDPTTLELLEEYSKRDSRIRSIKKANGGQSSARNAGLSIAQGTYISFVDHDDMLNLHMYEILFEATEKGRMDVAECWYLSLPFNDTGKIDLQHRPQVKQRQIQLQEDKDFLVDNIQIWKRICRLDFLMQNEIKFDDLRWEEDVLFSYKVLICAASIAFIDEALYFHVRHNENTTTTLGDKIFDAFKAHDLLRKFLKERKCFESYERQFNGRMLKDILVNLDILLQSQEPARTISFFREAEKRIKDIPIMHYRSYYSSSKKKMLKIIQKGDYEKYLKYRRYKNFRKSITNFRNAKSAICGILSKIKLKKEF